MRDTEKESLARKAHPAGEVSRATGGDVTRALTLHAVSIGFTMSKSAVDIGALTTGPVTADGSLERLGLVASRAGGRGRHRTLTLDVSDFTATTAPRVVRRVREAARLRSHAATTLVGQLVAAQLSLGQRVIAFQDLPEHLVLGRVEELAPTAEVAIHLVAARSPGGTLARSHRWRSAGRGTGVAVAVEVHRAKRHMQHGKTTLRQVVRPRRVREGGGARGVAHRRETEGGPPCGVHGGGRHGRAEDRGLRGRR